MADKKEVDILVSQLREIMLDRPLSDVQVQSEELKELQGAILYLSTCMNEFQTFFKNICAGNLDVPTPSKENFMAGSLKEIHSILKHLTWLASQVAEGDYNHKVTFLGDFSNSFNKMVSQLEEREIRLKEKTEALMQSTDLLISIIDKQNAWILVVDVETKDILYCNEKAKEKFYDPIKKKSFCEQHCEMLESLIENESNQHYEKEYHCAIINRTFHTKGFPLVWNERKTIAYFIDDITLEKQEKVELKNLAYHDALTGLYNRRYCFEQLEKCLKKQSGFAIALLDLDRLKYVNDHFGHLAGDEYIMHIANILKQYASNENIVCRIGGDEFIIIGIKHNEQSLREILVKIASQFSEQTKQYDGSLSFGVKEIAENNVYTAKEVLKLADEAMYMMKEKRINIK